MRQRGLCWPLVAAAVLAAAPAGADETVRLTAVADAWVTAGSRADRNAGTTAALLITGYQFDPCAPEIAIEPANPKAGDRLTVRIKTPATTVDGKPVACRYLWHRYHGSRPALIQESDRPGLDRAVKAGERWRVVVAAIAKNRRTAVAWAEVVVAGGATPTTKAAPGPWGQFLHRRAYIAFDVKRLAGRRIVSARLALYARPDSSWRRKAADTSILVHAVPRARAGFDEGRVTWRTQPTPEPVGAPIAAIDLPGRFVTEDDPAWQAWSKLHNATWKDRNRHATAFSNDPTHGLWRWREVDVTAAVRREAAPGAGRLAFCLIEPLRSTHRRSTCAVRSREYADGRYAPALVVTCR